MLHGSGPIWNQWLETRSLSTQQQIQWKHWGDKDGEERSWPSYLTMPLAQDKCPLEQASPQHTDRIWDIPLPFLIIHMYMRLTGFGESIRIFL